MEDNFRELPIFVEVDAAVLVVVTDDHTKVMPVMDRMTHVCEVQRLAFGLS